MTAPADPSPADLTQADLSGVLRRALIEIRALKEKLAAAESAPRDVVEPVAVVGIGCRFPGGADGPAAFWRLLMEGRDAVGTRPGGRWEASSAAPREGGYLADIEGFDPRFFAISPREAAAMDPQHRLLLEVAWEALEHAAIDPDSLAGSRTGVFVGLATNDFARGVPDAAIDRYYGVGSSPAVASGRLAYLLDLRGPCLTLDTACSSSLVAVHYAMRALRDRDCDTALAGGVSLLLGAALGESFVAAGMLAPDGRCKSFDARADGYGRGEGAGMVVLRLLSDALRAGDPVLAVLRGSAVNQDGRSAGLTAPNGPAQTALIRAALSAAGLAPDDIDYVEAHGTGTPLGDPIEWHALAAAFAGRAAPLPVGSVKSNIGHTEAASGIAGLIKAVLAVRAGVAPPSLHFSRRNPAIGGGGAVLEVVVAPRPGVRRAGVSAFGFSGTNAHVVVEAPPAVAAPVCTGGGVLLLSAQDAPALRELAGRYARAFADGLDFAAACHTAATGRALLPWWISVRSPAELATAVPSDAPPPALPPSTGPRIALPAYPFQRQRFPLPGAAPAQRVLSPDDPLLAGTDGLCHLGVLLVLLGQQAGSLADVTFPGALAVAAPRDVRVDRSGGRIALQSRPCGETEWSTHLAARPFAAETAPPGLAAGTPTATEAAALYARIEAAGFRYGPAARGLDAVGVDGAAACGRLRDGLGWGPGAIEAAAQLAYAVLPAGAAPVMLAGADNLQWSAGAPATAWLRLASSGQNGTMRADFGVCGEAGQTLLHVRGARFEILPDHAARWSRIVAWRQVPPPAAGANASASAAFVWAVPQGDPATLCAALLEVLPQAGGSALLIVTQGGQRVGDEATPPSLGHAAIWGMAQAVMAEQPSLRCRLVDLDPGIAGDARAAVVDLEAVLQDEPCVAWRGGRRLARRLEAPPRCPATTETATLPAPGLLRWETREDAPPGPGMVRIDVVAAGLTFRDRLLFNGLAPAGSTLGADCAGVVRAVGTGVAAIRPGDRVVALAAGAVAGHVTVPEADVAPAPCADLVAAATMPVPYLTALAALPPLGSFDCVLVHQATSATGLAAMAVARRAGARIVATAARHRHARLAEDGVAHILDSRDPASWGAALAGVTVAFGAFGAEAAALLGCATVINLDKRAPGHFDLDRVDPAHKQRLLAQLRDWAPLPRRVVPRAALQTALSEPGPMAGRSVVLLRDPPPALIAAGATYLVTGAAGALGGMVADWLEGAGATVCRVDRAALPAGVPHLSVLADIGDAAVMEAVFERLRQAAPPLRGVFHCAAVTDDDRLEAQTAERLAAVLRAKVDGAVVLDRLTRTYCTGAAQLDHFVLFASVVGVLPSARQAGYAAANAVLDQLAQARSRHGLPGLSLDWGPWAAGIGRQMGARAAATWRQFGVTPILPALGLRALPSLLAAPEAQRVVADMAWDRAAAAAVPARAEPRAESGAEPRAEARAELGPVTVERLQAILAPLLAVADAATLDPDAPLLSFGLDSLTAVEFARALSRTLGRPVAPDVVYNYPTLTLVAQNLNQLRPAPVARQGGFTLRMPVWRAGPNGPALACAWAVAGQGQVAAGLRARMAAGEAGLADLTALDIAPDADAACRNALFAGMLERLRRHAGAPAQIVLVAPEHGAVAGAMEGFAVGLAAEQPAWSVRSVRLGAGLADPAGTLARELSMQASGARTRLAGQGRETVQLEPLLAATPWRPSPNATYLVTGGSGGIGGLVTRHLVAQGARHLVLASRSGAMPPDLADRPALADGPAQVRPVRTDLANPGDLAALLHAARAAQPPLRGLFHTAGVTANGALSAGWDRLGAAFPAKADAARSLDMLTRDMELDVFVLFSSTTAWFGLPGTSGYAAANGFLDGVAQERRAAGLNAVSIAWCAWQGVGMAADPATWQGGRAPALPPETALAAMDAALAAGAASVVVTDPDWPCAAGPGAAAPALLAVGDA